MTFPEFLQEVKKLKREELRVEEAEYLEIVVAKEDLAPLHKVLSAHLGSPLKPEGQVPSREADRRAKLYGGVRKDQTMYFRQGSDGCVCVLLWPWGSGTRITVKIIRDGDALPPESSGKSSFLGRLFGRKQ
jgi:hypothetical protein